MKNYELINKHVHELLHIFMESTAEKRAYYVDTLIGELQQSQRRIISLKGKLREYPPSTAFFSSIGDSLLHEADRESKIRERIETLRYVSTLKRDTEQKQLELAKEVESLRKDLF